MDINSRIEQVLTQAVARVDQGCPDGLARATRHAVFPGGARVRPRLCLSVAAACGGDDRLLADSAACAIELLHCASLVHDDLPCFDNAATRRGAASVHQAFGERLAVLTGDALIVLSFQALAAGATQSPQRLVSLLTIVGESVGLPRGIVAGQAMECESAVALADYHRAKTGALFAAAAMAGAAAAGVDPEPWRRVGQGIGHAYQVVDDIRDATGSAELLGKPSGQDALLGRPNSVSERGLEQALVQFDDIMHDILATIPACPGASALRERIIEESKQLVPAFAPESAA